MMKKIYVINLPYRLTTEQLREYFASFGAITEAFVVMDKVQHRSRGFGFVEFATAEAAQKAIQQTNGQLLDGRPLLVAEAKPPLASPSRSDPAGYRKVLEPADLLTDSVFPLRP